MKTRFLCGLVVLEFAPLMVFGALSTTTSYFHNIVVNTNITLGGIARSDWPNASNITPFTNQTRIVIEGDSLSTGFAIPSGKGWDYWLSNSFMSSLNLHWGTNAAAAGEAVSTMQANYTAQVYPWRPASGTNAVLFFWGGINDLATQTIATTFNRITNYWATAKSNDFIVVAFTITDSINLPEAIRPQIAYLNNLIRAHSFPEYGVDYLIDVATLFSDVQDTTWCIDGVHWTEIANRLLASYITWSLRFGSEFPERISGIRSNPDNAFRYSRSDTNYVGEQLVTNNIGALLSVGDTAFVDVRKASQTNAVSGAVTFTHATNGLNGVDYTHVRWLFNSSGSDQTISVPSGWRTNIYSAVPSKLTNGTITRMLLSCGGPTSTTAMQTNCYVSFEYYK